MIGLDGGKTMQAIEQSHILAQELIETMNDPLSLSDLEKMMICAAHYSLATQIEQPLIHSQFHINSAITLLQSVSDQDSHWANEISLAYFKRAELAEDNERISQAIGDYQRIVDILETLKHRSDNQHMLLAQSYLAIADLGYIEHHQISLETAKFYAQQSIDELQQITEKDSEIWHTLSYAHQTLAVVFHESDPEKALSHIHQALHYSFKTEGNLAGSVIGDCYQLLSFFYHQETLHKQTSWNSLNAEYASRVYHDLSGFFNTGSEVSEEQALRTLQNILELPILILRFKGATLSPSVLMDLIEGLIFIHECLTAQSLQSVPSELIQLDPFLFEENFNHLQKLIQYYFERHENQTLKPQFPENLELDYYQIVLDYFQQTKCKIYYFSRPQANATPMPL